jgi:NAD-dependent SIR2 family protein deacetylase
MVQLGWNSGPRHATVWGKAKSYTKVLDQETMVTHDEDAIALLTLRWSIAKATLPTDVTDNIKKLLEEHGLPHIATRNVDTGHFLHLFIFLCYSSILHGF